MNKNRVNALHKNFCRKGKLALKFRSECIAMLPEVFRLKVYEKKGFTSIYEYAAKKAGLSRKQVQRTLQIEQKCEGKPHLHKALTSGEVSINKLARVVGIATKQNEEFWAEKAKQLPQKALETLVTEARNENQNGLFEGKNTPKSVRAHTFQNTPLQLDEDIENELLELQEKGININELLRELLKKRKIELAREKEKLAAAPEVAQAKSRYIPVKVRKIVAREHGTQCSINNCQKPSKEIHHTQRFALTKSHDPHYLAPLCREHHTIAHTIDVKYHQKRRC